LQEELSAVSARLHDAERRVDHEKSKSDALREKVGALKKKHRKARKTIKRYEKFPDVIVYNFMRKAKRKLLSTQRGKGRQPVDTNRPERQPVDTNRPERETVDIPAGHDPSAFRGRLKTDRLADLKIACILDPLSYSCFSPESKFLQLTPEHWQEEIQAFAPDLFFVESAWQGKDDLWIGKVSNPNDILSSLLSFCRAQGIPIVFWSKEDPMHFDRFIHVAKKADFVFTTGKECLEKYKEKIGHESVFFLHFAAQQRVHNPIELHKRQDKFCFAGSYYKELPERTRQFDNIAHYAMRTKGLDIYDRFFGEDRKNRNFPEYYNYYIKGGLPPEKIDAAYKGYLYNINMNSEQYTETMFARRVFELLASNTIVVSNYSRGMENYLGDLVIDSDDVEQLDRKLKERCPDRQSLRRHRLQALRKVLSGELYTDRLINIVNKVFLADIAYAPPRITVVARAGTEAEAEKTYAVFRAQNYQNKRLVLLTDLKSVAMTYDDAKTLQGKAGTCVRDLAEEGWIAYFDGNDWYGPNYLLDMALTTRYFDGAAIGKSAYYAADGDQVNLVNENDVYLRAQPLILKRSILRAESFQDLLFEGRSLTTPIECGETLSIDEFNYCEGWGNRSGELEADAARQREISP
jgi:spore maturation protein CgeB